MVAVVVGVIGLSLALQMVDHIPFPDSLIIALLLMNLIASLLALQKEGARENSAPGS